MLTAAMLGARRIESSLGRCASSVASGRVQPGRAHAVGFSPVRVGMRPAASSTAHSPYGYLIISPLIGQKL
eukprot:21430-Pelagococcus_subviridis.AAC.1